MKADKLSYSSAPSSTTTRMIMKSETPTTEEEENNVVGGNKQQLADRMCSSSPQSMPGGIPAGYYLNGIGIQQSIARLGNNQIIVCLFVSLILSISFRFGFREFDDRWWSSSSARTDPADSRRVVVGPSV